MTFLNSFIEWFELKRMGVGILKSEFNPGLLISVPIMSLIEFPASLTLSVLVVLTWRKHPHGSLAV